MSKLTFNRSLAERFCEIIKEQLGLPDTFIITLGATWEDLGADSLDLIELISAFEEELDIMISDEEVERCPTVSLAYSLVEKLYRDTPVDKPIIIMKEV